MKTKLSLALTALLSLTLLPQVASADGTEISFNLETGLQSTYIWRGAQVYTDQTTPLNSSNASISLSGLGPGSLTFGVWNGTAASNYRINDASSLEIDAYTSYTVALGDVSASAGYTGYFLPETEGGPVDAAHEFIGNVSYQGDFFSPFVFAAIEPVRLRGIYLSLGGSKTIPIVPKWSYTTQLSYGLEGYETSSFSSADATFTHQVTWNVNRGFYVSSSLNSALNLRGGVPWGDSFSFWGGFAFGING